MIITVYGDPKAQPRPKACVRGRHAGVYDPGTANGWKALIAAAVKQNFDLDTHEPWEGAVWVGIDFFLHRPKRLYRQADPEGPVLHTVRPDRDNLEKAVLDVLTELGLWRDDCQVCAGPPRKFYHGKRGIPGCRITLVEVPLDHYSSQVQDLKGAGDDGHGG